MRLLAKKCWLTSLQPRTFLGMRSQRRVRRPAVCPPPLSEPQHVHGEAILVCKRA